MCYTFNVSIRVRNLKLELIIVSRVNMIDLKKVIVVMPAYNAESTLEVTLSEIPDDIVDQVILVDDYSYDGTYELAKKLGIPHVIKHEKNKGYGGNQKTCYTKALSLDADIVIMLHPDYQYTPKLVRSMASLIAEGLFDCVLGSRILGNGALKGGMPVYKYVSNRLLTFIQNLIIGAKLSEYHTGYRAFSREVLENLPLKNFSDDFIFDNQLLLKIIEKNYRIGEITCPTKYMDEASSIGGIKLLKYGVGVLFETIKYRLSKMGILKNTIY